MSRRLHVTRRAKQDIERIDAWWVENRQLSADLFFLELQDAFDMLKRRPTIGQRYVSRSGSFRRVLLRGTRYHVYYKILPAQVVVTAVWSAVRGRGPVL